MPLGPLGNPDVLKADPAATAAGVVVRGVGGGFGGAAAVDSCTISRVAVGSGAAVTVLAANTARKGYKIQSEFANTDVVYIKEGAGASAADAGDEVQPGGRAEPLVNYRGIITARAASGTQNLKVTEY